jgi:hypothetical protein
MSLKSGLAAQIGFAAEATTTPGTRATPTRFLEFVSEDLSLNVQRIESMGLRAGRRTTHRWVPGTREVSGGFSVEMAAQGTGLLLSHAFGTVATTGANPYVHTFTPGPLDTKTLTVQVGRPDHGGTVRAFDYLGCSITEWELSAEVNQFLAGRFSVYGMDCATSHSLASASYPSGYSPFVFTQGTLSIASAAVCVRQVQVRGSNGLATGRHRICADGNKPKVALEAGFREYTGSVALDFDTLDPYNLFVNGTEAALSLSFDAGTSAKLVITGNVRFDGDTPHVSGPDLLEQPLSFKYVSSTSDAAAITATLTNADATP